MSLHSVKPPLIIIGASGHAVSCANVAVSAGFNIIGFIDDAKVASSVVGIPVFGRETFLTKHSLVNCVVAIGDNFLRQKVVEQLLNDLPNISFSSVIHATASIGMNTQIGDGCVVMPNSVVGPNCELGAHCIVNTKASIDHDSALSDFASVAPGVTMGGGVSVGHGSAISIGVTVKHGVALGSHSVVGASSYVHDDIPNNVLCFGTPAKVIRTRTPGERYLG